VGWLKVSVTEYDTLGFQTGQGINWAAAGFFDLYARITTAATTPLAGTLMARLTYAE